MARQTWSTTTGDTRFAFSAATSAGTVRAGNEDSLLARPPVFLVADGMGGHARGDAASATAVAAFDRRIVGSRPWTPEAVLDTIQEAHAEVLLIEGPEVLAGTTLAGVVLVATAAAPLAIDEDTADAGASEQVVEESYRWMVVNVGDSRVYALDDEGLRQLTVDHSVVRELVERGLLSEREASVHPERNVITRALGVQAAATPDVLLLHAEGSHMFLVCSDGVSGSIEAAELELVLRRSAGTDSAAQLIVELAMDHGSRDNVTAIVLEATVAAHRRPDTEDDRVEQTQPRPGGRT